MEPSACKVPTTSKKPLSTWSFLSSHDLSWLQWTVAAGPADRREQRRQPRACVHICAAWRGRARRWPHPLRPAAAAHYPHCGSRACQRRALAGLRTARSAGAGSRSESAQERVGRSGWGRGAQAYGTARTPRRAGPTARANPQGPRRESSHRGRHRCWEKSEEEARENENIYTTSSRILAWVTKSALRRPSLLGEKSEEGANKREYLDNEHTDHRIRTTLCHHFVPARPHLWFSWQEAGASGASSGVNQSCKFAASASATSVHARVVPGRLLEVTDPHVQATAVRPTLHHTLARSALHKESPCRGPHTLALCGTARR